MKSVAMSRSTGQVMFWAFAMLAAIAGLLLVMSSQKVSLLLAGTKPELERRQAVAELCANLSFESKLIDLWEAGNEQGELKLDAARVERLPNIELLLADANYSKQTQELVNVHDLLCRDRLWKMARARKLWGLANDDQLAASRQIRQRQSEWQKALQNLRLTAQQNTVKREAVIQDAVRAANWWIVAFILGLVGAGAAWLTAVDRSGAGRHLSLVAESLKRKEKALFRHAVDLVCLLAPDLTVLQVSPSVERILGYTTSEFSGRNLVDFTTGDTKGNHLQDSLTVSKSRDYLQFEQQLLSKDGRVVDMLWTAHWSHTEKTFFCIAHDISERKQVQAKIEELARKLHRLLEHLPVGICVLDRAQCILQVNSTLCQMVGRADRELIGQPVIEILPEVKDVAASGLIEQSELARPTLETICATATGSSLPVEITVGLFDDETDTRYSIALFDCTQRYELEKLKREFIAVVSHELKAPLMSIDAALQLIDEGCYGPLPEPVPERVALVRRETRRLCRLVNDLLMLEKMKAGKFELCLLDTPVDELIMQSVEAVSAYGQRLKVRIITVPCGLYAFVDGARVMQALINLLSNALKYSAPGSCVEVLAESHNDMVKVTVQDHGRGIPPEALERIFGKYEQVSNADALEKGGTGLGLAISKTIIEQHGGKIWAESVVGQGSSFHFLLPGVEAAADGDNPA